MNNTDLRKYVSLRTEVEVVTIEWVGRVSRVLQLQWAAVWVPECLLCGDRGGCVAAPAAQLSWVVLPPV